MVPHKMVQPAEMVVLVLTAVRACAIRASVISVKGSDKQTNEQT